MTSPMILIDTSFLISFLRKDKNLRRLLVPYIQSGKLVSCGLVRAEVVRGLSQIKLKNEVSDLFDVTPEVPCNAKLWQEVTNLAWALDRKGIALPVTDLVIAACAMSKQATLITVDKHFKKIPKLKTRKTLPPLHKL